MKLIIGGAGQGKLAYVLGQEQLDREQVADGASSSWADFEDKPIIDHFPLLVKRLLSEGKEPYGYLEQLLAANPYCIIICDEIGCGLVPMEQEERQWRELTGRLGCLLAAKASQVVRVYYGLSQILKEDIC